jgi:hypothetical protein
LYAQAKRKKTPTPMITTMPAGTPVVTACKTDLTGDLNMAKQIFLMVCSGRRLHILQNFSLRTCKVVSIMVSKF